jgi:hypothetical protein
VPKPIKLPYTSSSFDYYFIREKVAVMVSVLPPVSLRSLARSQQSPVDSSPPGLTYATPTEMEVLVMGRTKSAGTGSNKGRHGMAWHGMAWIAAGLATRARQRHPPLAHARVP